MSMRGRIAARLKKLNFGTQLLFAMIPFIVLAFFFNGWIFANTMKQRLEEDAIVNMQDVAGRTRYYIESHLNSVYNLFASLESDPSLYNLKNGLHNRRIDGKVSQYYIDLDILLKSALASNQNSLESIYINFNDGGLMVQKFAHYTMNVNYTYQAWKEKYPESKIYFKSIQEVPDVSGNEISAIIFRLYEAENINGIIIYAIKNNFFKDILGQLKIYDNSEFCILTGDGTCLDFSNNENRRALSPKVVSSVMNSADDEIILADDGEYVYAVPIANTDWKLAIRVPEQDVMKNAIQLWRTYAIMASISVLLLCAVIIVVTKRISTPLRKLTRRIVEMKNENLQAEFDVDGCREIEILNMELYRMHEYSIRLMEEIKQERDLKRKAELSVLQEQIKPHFLYNSLYSIQQLCELGENRQAAKMIGALSRFYRLGISGGSDMITIQMELQHAENYLQIQKMRYSDLLDYVVDCDPVIYPYEIPKLVLQPLVENAIYHGIKQSHKKGFISIVGGLDGNDIVLEVHDDGAGMSAEEVKKLCKNLEENTVGSSIGLKNVNYRLKKCYGDGYGIEIDSQREVDTCIRLRIARVTHK